MYTGIGTVQRHCGREGVEKWQWLVVCPDRTREGQPPASVHRDRDSSKTLWGRALTDGWNQYGLS